jgi:formylglycine-generating enzyme required for sulfatase activity
MIITPITPVLSKKNVFGVVATLFLALVLAGCWGGGDTAGSGEDGASLVNADNLEELFMVKVTGGTFKIGCEGGGTENANCLPSKDTTIADFYICKYEVTQGLWKNVMGEESPSKYKGVDLPVDNVMYSRVQSFITALNAKKPGFGYRFLKEAEWEYAARGGAEGSGTYSGSDDINSVAWYSGNSGARPQKVGTRAANALGINDMSGNVWEWVERAGTPGNYEYVERGGSWYGPAQYGSVTYRNLLKTETIGGVEVTAANNASPDRGFRIARNKLPTDP